MPRICVLSTSPSSDSRSRQAAQRAVELLETIADVEADYIDLQETPVELYPGTHGDERRADLVRRFNAADGWILAGAVYNGGPSAHIVNFLHFALKPGATPPGLPFFLIASAGGSAGVFAFDALGARIRREVKAVEVATPVLASSDAAENEKRLAAQIELLLPLAELYGKRKEAS